MLQTIIGALDGLAVNVVVTTGPAVDPARLRVRPGVEVHRYRPHVEVMPTASLVIGHGGHATTMLALAHDLPLVIMPVHPGLDQSMIGTAPSIPPARIRAPQRQAPRTGTSCPPRPAARSAAPTPHQCTWPACHPQPGASVPRTPRPPPGARPAPDLITGPPWRERARSHRGNYRRPVKAQSRGWPFARSGRRDLRHTAAPCRRSCRRLARAGTPSGVKSNAGSG